VTDNLSSVVVPNQELAGFKKVNIPYVFFNSSSVTYSTSNGIWISAGKSVTVTIPILSTQLALWSIQNKWVVEPGTFNIKVGTSDQIFAQTTLTVR
jgi:beta-glucosidase